MLSVGSTFAGYRIERLLGVGGMGVVYLARSPELPRSDALKVLSTELSRDADFRARFVREADVAAVLDHPNIVSVHRRGEFQGQLWIAMQFVDGTDADAVLRDGTMTPARAVHITSEVGKALDYAHHRGVVHRDVKPANFLLSGRPGIEERVLLGDFGIARALGDVGLTHAGSVMATLSYAAPEVLAGAPFDHRADLYSLGCTLFRMLTGQTPFSPANGPAAMLAAHLHQPPPRVSDRVPGLSQGMDRVIAIAMAKDPARRFASARQLAAAAAEALNDRTVPVTAPWRPIPGANVNPYPSSSDSGPWWQHSSGARTELAPPPWPNYFPQPPKRRRGRRLAAISATAAILVAAAVTAVILSARSHPNNASKPPRVTVSTTTTSAQPVPVAVTAMSALLLTPEQVAEIMGADKLVQDAFADTVIDDSPKLEEKNCIGVVAPAQHLVYANTGWTAIRSQALRNPGEGPRSYQVIQAVIAFPEPQAAQSVLAAQKSQWSGCSGHPYTLNFPTPPTPQRWTAGPLTDSADTLSMTQQLEDGGGMGCQRVMSTRNNVVIDIVACRYDVTNQGVNLLNAIAARIPS